MNKEIMEARRWWDAAINAGKERAEQVGRYTGEKALHCNSFICGVEWVLKHQPIPKAYKKKPEFLTIQDK